MTLNKNSALGYRFGMLARLNLFFLNEQLKPLGLSAGQVACLAELLQNRAPLTQDEISLSLAVDPAATARTVDLLIKKGLAHRQVNPENRRQKLVSATPRAKEMEKEFFDILKDVEDNFKIGITDKEYQDALKIMDRMILSAGRKKHERQ